MREIKFRAWVKEVYEDGEFAYGGYMIQSHEIKRLILGSATNLMLGGAGTGIEIFQQGMALPGLGSLQRFDFNEIELMQYTGLHDKNGVEIYEGDVVKVTTVDLSETIHKVAYRIDIDYPAFDLQPELVDDCNSLSFVCCAVDNEVEVIGNVHEHPDLLTRAEAE